MGGMGIRNGGLATHPRDAFAQEAGARQRTGKTFANGLSVAPLWRKRYGNVCLVAPATSASAGEERGPEGDMQVAKVPILEVHGGSKRLPATRPRATLEDREDAADVRDLRQPNAK